MSTRQPYSEARAFMEETTGGPLTLGKTLWSIRKCDEISQVDMAERLGISRANLCDIEKGRRFVSPDRAAKWADTLGYSAEQFVRLSLQDRVRQSGLKMIVRVEPDRKRTKGKAA